MLTICNFMAMVASRQLDDDSLTAQGYRNKAQLVKAIIMFMLL